MYKVVDYNSCAKKSSILQLGTRNLGEISRHFIWVNYLKLYLGEAHSFLFFSFLLKSDDIQCVHLQPPRRLSVL